MGNRITYTTAILVFTSLVLYGGFIFFSKTRIYVDKKEIVHFSLKKGTVQKLLDRYHIALSSADLVEPELDHEIRWGENVRVIRVTQKSEIKNEEESFTLSWRRRTTKNFKRLVEVQDGYKVVTKLKVKHIFHDDQEVETIRKELKRQKVHTQRLLLLNEKNFPEKIYDLSQAKKITVVATAYWEGDPQVPGVITFSGHRVERGLVAVDPPVIPLGYRLYIPSYGYAYSSDTGSAIKGKRIDLFVENKKASRAWEYKKVDVYILEKADKW